MIQMVIPARNEARRLPTTLGLIADHVARRGDRVVELELIVVDNGSDDGTGDIARRAATASLPIRVVQCGIPGKGAAVRAGVLATSAAVVGYMDADCATDLGALDDALDLLADGHDVAIGSRAVPGADVHARHSSLRSAGAAWYRYLARRIVPGIADTQCGFKAMRGDIGRRVFADMVSTGFSFDVELLGRLQRSGCDIVEYPVRWIDVEGSSFNPFRHGVDAFVELHRIAGRLRDLDDVSARPAVVPPDVRSAIPETP